jgi:hypothetical protein
MYSVEQRGFISDPFVKHIRVMEKQVSESLEKISCSNSAV